MLGEDEDVARSYGATKPSESFIAYKNPTSQFSQNINDISKVLAGNCPNPKRLIPLTFLNY